MKQARISERARIAPNAVICGNVEVEAEASVWYHTTIRSESAPIRIGAGSNIQDNCVLHVDEEFGVTVEPNVTVGHGVILHGCFVGENSLIGMGSIILNGAHIGRNCIIGAGSLVTQGTVIPDGMMAFGNPAKVRRAVTEEEIAANAGYAVNYQRESKEFGEQGWYL